MQQLEGKTAFITGGASGIGLGIARAFVKHGMKVVIADARRDALDEAVAGFQKKGQSVHPLQMNVTDRTACARAADEAESVFGKIHVLVANAGVGSGSGAIDRLNYKDWDYSLSVNVGGVVNSVMTFVPRILKHGEGGHIVATSSTCGLMGSSNFTIYCTTKYAVCGMMECVATDLQGRHIGVSILIPGPTVSNLGKSSFENRPAQLRIEGQTWPPPPPPPDGRPRRSPAEMQGIFMNPDETGERVVRGIRNNDLYIITHPEFKAGFNARNEAIMRACPAEPRNEKRWEVVKNFGTIIYNDIYDQQKQVGPPDW